ncbi:MAG: IS3 family transposase, partial [Gammaproteobacteria bacterium]|nr:IS3 family transposase [Gammaproteobacteria bacterium]
MRYGCIHRRRKLYPIRLMSRLLKVSPSGYYAWRVRPEPQRARDDRTLMRAVRRIHTESDGTYGSPRIHTALKTEGLWCGRSRVARLMREARLKGCPKRRFRVGSKSSAVSTPNLLNQDFSASGANRRWASDITYISTTQGWLYLAVVMDLYSRRIVGWSMNRRIGRQVALDALDMALGQRQPTSALIHHSDRGPQYLSDEYQRLLRRHGITCSMSSAGSCYDNAVVERFFATLKRERTRRRQYRTRDDARAD